MSDVARPHRGTIFLEEAAVVSVQTFPGDQFIVRLAAPKTAAAATPGSFVHLTCDDAIPMRRPLSIMRAGDGWVEVLFKIVGDGLKALARQTPGQVVSVLGPIGNGFTPRPQRPRAVMVGGGVGIPPMVFLAERLAAAAEPYEAVVFMGSELPFPFQTGTSGLAVAGIEDEVSACMPLIESLGFPSRLASLSGFEGCHEGYVTELADRHLGALNAGQKECVELFACGPTPMLAAVAAVAARHDVPCQVSLEEFMACAVGGCAGCTVPVTTDAGTAMKRVCVDGPVFDAASVFPDQAA